MTKDKEETLPGDAPQPIYDANNPPPPPKNPPPPPNYPHPDDVQAEGKARLTKSKKNRKAVQYTHSTESKEEGDLKKAAVATLLRTIGEGNLDELNQMSEDAARDLAKKLKLAIKEFTSNNNGSPSASAIKVLNETGVQAVHEAVLSKKVEIEPLKPEEIEEEEEITDYLDLQGFIDSQLDTLGVEQFEIFMDNTTFEGPVDKAVRTLIKETCRVLNDPNINLSDENRTVAKKFVKDLFTQLAASARAIEPEGTENQSLLAEKCLQIIREYQPKLEKVTGLWSQIKEFIKSIVEIITNTKRQLATEEPALAATVAKYKETISDLKQSTDEPEPDQAPVIKPQ